MNASFYIAKRYLFSKKSTNAINMISGISMLGVFIGSAALIIILSVFNGFEGLVLSMYDSYSPHLKVEAVKGKSFDPETPFFKQLETNAQIFSYTQVLQEKALLRYDDLQFIGKVKGVSKDFLKNNLLDSSLVQGEFVLGDSSQQLVVIGATVQYVLGVNINNPLKRLEIYSPKKGTQSAFTPVDEFVAAYLQPVGVFQTQQEESDMVIVPIETARTLLQEAKNVSAIEIFLKDEEQVETFKKYLEKNLGSAFIVKNRIQQNALLYKILNSEKWAIYLILTFILVIAIFNIIGSLTMLVIDKRRDIAILNSLGASKTMISRIFLYEGLMIAMLGCFLGLLAGLAFCLLQQEFGLISMGQANLLIDAYPVKLKIADFFLVFMTVFTISFIAAFISSRLSIKRFEKLKEDL
ncbi:FtsX-like permease family protein [Pedobacter glucosidilyticus]|uniref:FtsX-like permease family protein n=1 Tax=Pedobacter glucosidilyticus TaxID=1122941 RepID=UPI0026ECC3BB|nr:FtsX-like permease family protein [Pedobacter glucosidilyticus]